MNTPHFLAVGCEVWFRPVTGAPVVAVIVKPTSPVSAEHLAQMFNSHASVLNALRILSAEDSQCSPDWWRQKRDARRALADAEGNR